MTGEAWRQYLQTYVALRRAIGFTMQREVRLLQDFVEHLERRGHDAPVAQVAVCGNETAVSADASQAAAAPPSHRNGGLIASQSSSRTPSRIEAILQADWASRPVRQHADGHRCRGGLSACRGDPRAHRREARAHRRGRR